MRNVPAPATAPTVGVDRIDAMSTVLTGYKSAPAVRDAGRPADWSYVLIAPAATDLFGNALPGDGLPDIGAHEYTAAVA